MRIAYHRAQDLPVPAELTAHERVEFVTSPGRRGDGWAEQIVELRSLRAPKLRARALRRMVQAVTDEERSHLVASCPRCDARLVDEEVAGMLLAFRKTGLAYIQTWMRNGMAYMKSR